MTSSGYIVIGITTLMRPILSSIGSYNHERAAWLLEALRSVNTQLLMKIPRLPHWH